jgi:hypothetical protein
MAILADIKHHTGLNVLVRGGPEHAQLAELEIRNEEGSVRIALFLSKNELAALRDGFAQALMHVVVDIDQQEHRKASTRKAGPDDVREALSHLVESVMDQDNFDSDPRLDLAVSQANAVLAGRRPWCDN